jgi:hypothetical protein
MPQAAPVTPGSEPFDLTGGPGVRVRLPALPETA